MRTSVTILITILFITMSACVESQPTLPSAKLPKPTVYEWIGAGPHPSPQRLAHDKFTCFQDAERKESRRMSDRWQAHVNSCMQDKGWGQKAID
jgi:hypothetical protein